MEEPNAITQIFLPLAIAFIMAGMGLSLIPDDFKRIAKYPKAVLLGLFLKVLFLPVVAFLILLLIPTTPELAVGVILLAALPGGATSNMITNLAKGDVALSITLTAIASILTVGTIPMFLDLALEHYMQNNQTIEMPVVKTIIQIMAITVVPVMIGMVINNRAPQFALKADKPVRIISAVFLALIIVAAIAKDFEMLSSNIAVIGPICIALNIVAMGLGFFSGKLFGLSKAQSITFSIETGIVNGVLGISIAAGILNSQTITLPSAIYGVLMFFTIALVIWYGNKNSTITNL